MSDNDPGLEELKRRLLLPPEQRRKAHRKELERKIREQPEKISEEAFRRGALRFFLRHYRTVEPKLLEELRETLPVLDSVQHLPENLSDRYHLPRTITVAVECLKTLLMWQAFPALPNVWHFERPEGALADPLHTAKTSPYPVVFVAEGWKPDTETLNDAMKRLVRQFKDTLRDKATFWKSAEIDHSELRLFEESTSGKLRRNLQCLAEKQANPRLSYQRIAKELDLSRDGVRLAIWEAAELVGLPRELIRKAPAGAPSGERPE